jgi:hypothetical protein
MKFDRLCLSSFVEQEGNTLRDVTFTQPSVFQ